MSGENKPENVERRLYSIPDAVEYLRSIGATAATPNFVRNLISSSAVPHIRIGKKFYITRVALDGWLTSRERKSR
jgi:hypothetical protein